MPRITMYFLLLSCLFITAIRPTFGHAQLVESFDQTIESLREKNWQIPENATIVSNHFFSNPQSLHLAVEDPGNQKTFVDYFLPVEEGKFYQAEVYIKTRGVQRHLQGGYNRGAVLFLQLADQNKKYVSGGSFPRGLIGDNDWTHHRIVSTNRIPPQAAYLHVTIGIEGQGEAWFDDLKITEITPTNFQGVEVVSPLPQEQIDDLRPTFTIRERLGEIRRLACRVELSQSPQFPADQTITEDLTEAPYRLTQWLAPGIWHYRIIHSVGGVELPAPASRSLVITDTASAWPPIIHPQWQWTDVAHPSLEVRIGYPQVDRLEVNLTIDGQSAEIIERSGDRIHFRPQADLSSGGHLVRIEATDDGRTEILERLFSNQQPAARVTFRKDRVMLIDGEPFFPLGTYRDPSDNLLTFDGVVSGGFNLTHDYLFEHTPQDIATARAYLDRAHQHGLKVFMGIPREKVYELDILWIQRWVAGLMDHPALLLWYLMDEPEKQGLSVASQEVLPEKLRQVADTVRAIDPFHPTTVVYCIPSRFHEWSGAHDLHWNDPYPLPNHPMTRVEQYTRTARQSEGEHGPVWTVLQGFDYRYAHGRERYKAIDQYGKPSQPTHEQTRLMAFLALASGSDGLVWYWLPKSSYSLIDDAPDAWRGIIETVRLLKQMEPWLLAGATQEDLAFKVPAPFRLWSRTSAGERLVAVMNASNEASELTLDLSSPAPAKVIDFESGDAIPMENHFVRFNLAPWEVRLVIFPHSQNRIAPTPRP